MNLVLTWGREGVQNLENLADVICACPLGAKSPCHSKGPVKADSDSHQQSASLLTNNVFLLSGLDCTILPVDR